MAIALLGTPTGSGTGGAGGNQTQSVAHTVGSGTNVVSYIFVYYLGTTISSMENFGGVAPQLVGSLADPPMSIYRVPSPATGAQTAQANLAAAPIAAGIMVVTFQGVQLSDPDDAVSNASLDQADANITIASAVGDVVIGFGAHISDNIAESFGSTLAIDQEGINDSFLSIGVVYEAGAASVQVGFTSTGGTFGDNVILGFNINAAAGAGDTPLTVDVGSLALQGQTITFPIGGAVGSADLALGAENVNLLADDSVVLPVEHQPLALEGQEIPFIMTIPGTAGALALEAQNLNLLAAATLPVTVGEMATQGQDVTLRFGGNISIVVDGNQLALAPINIVLTATGQPEVQENMLFTLVRPMVKIMTFQCTDLSRGG
jgi:hypothetical protein